MTETDRKMQKRSHRFPLMKYARPSKKAIRRKAKDSPPEGQLDLDGRPLAGLKLRDKIPTKAHTIFVGINPAQRSAEVGHYYAGHSNYFWKLIHASGIWPIPLKAENDDDLCAVGFGFTDVAKRPTPGVAHLSQSDFFESRRRLKRLVRKAQPRTVAFVGLMSVRAFEGDNSEEFEYGLQDWTINGSEVFVLPSTSGASLGHTSYAEKLKVWRALKTHISAYYDFKKKS